MKIKRIASLFLALSFVIVRQDEVMSEYFHIELPDNNNLEGTGLEYYTTDTSAMFEEYLQQVQKNLGNFSLDVKNEAAEKDAQEILDNIEAGEMHLTEEFVVNEAKKNIYFKSRTKDEVCKIINTYGLSSGCYKFMGAITEIRPDMLWLISNGRYESGAGVNCINYDGFPPCYPKYIGINGKNDGSSGKTLKVGDGGYIHYGYDVGPFQMNTMAYANGFASFLDFMYKRNPNEFKAKYFDSLKSIHGTDTTGGGGTYNMIDLVCKKSGLTEDKLYDVFISFLNQSGTGGASANACSVVTAKTYMPNSRTLNVDDFPIASGAKGQFGSTVEYTPEDFAYDLNNMVACVSTSNTDEGMYFMLLYYMGVEACAIQCVIEGKSVWNASNLSIQLGLAAAAVNDYFEQQNSFASIVPMPNYDNLSFNQKLFLGTIPGLLWGGCTVGLDKETLESITDSMSYTDVLNMSIGRNKHAYSSWPRRLYGAAGAQPKSSAESPDPNSYYNMINALE